MRHIIVLGAQVPFVKGGAELLNESLVSEINKLEGLSAELVQLPFKWYPEEQMLNDIMAWRLQDLSQANGKKIDLVIATKFPTYAVKHDNKVLWLVHQQRTIYDLKNTKYDAWRHQENSNGIRNKIIALDNQFFTECKKIYTIADTITDRLQKYNHFKSEALLPPPILADKIVTGDYTDYILYVGRLEPMKRVDLFVEALALSPKAKGLIVGRGFEFDNLKALIKKHKLEDRCKLLGFVSDQDLIEYLANARAIYYGPLDEDYGYATVEAFLAKKPVVTCIDSGEVESLVRKTGSGIVCENNAKSISVALDEIFNLSDLELEKMSQNGYDFSKTINWEEIIQKLVLDHLI